VLQPPLQTLRNPAPAPITGAIAGRTDLSAVMGASTTADAGQITPRGLGESRCGSGGVSPLRTSGSPC
jgi:hypothetical protein